MNNSTLKLRFTALFKCYAPITQSGLLLGLLLLFSGVAHAQNTYYWSGNGGTRLWSDANNWTTLNQPQGLTRTNPNPADVLIFDGDLFPALRTQVAITADFPASGGNRQQTIGQLKLLKGADVALVGVASGGSGATLNIAAPSATTATQGLLVEAGTKLTLTTQGNSGNGVIIRLGTNKTGTIGGEVNFTGNANNDSRLLANSAGAIEFESGSVATVFALRGSPFGTTAANASDLAAAGSVVFRSALSNTRNPIAGAMFIQQDGTNPFGLGPAPVAVFERTSLYVLRGGGFSVSQAYGNLQLEGPDIITNGSLTMSANNLTLVSGSLRFTQANEINATFTGNVVVGPNTTLAFNGSVNRVSLAGDLVVNGELATQSILTQLDFVGTTGQIIDGTVTSGGRRNLAFGSDVMVTINNTSPPNSSTDADGSGVTLQIPVTLNKELNLQSGPLYTSSANILRLGVDAVLTANSGRSRMGNFYGSYVSGPVARATSAGGGVAAKSYVFPVGKNGQYRPLTLNIANQTSQDPTVTYTAEQHDYPSATSSVQPADQLTRNFTPPYLSTSPLHHVSYRRYYQLMPSTTPGNFNGSVALAFGDDDYVTDASKPSLVVASMNAPSALASECQARGGCPAWTNLGRGATTPAPRPSLASGLFTAPAVVNFNANTPSNFTLASTEPSIGFPGTNPLPVVLTRFTATAKANGIALDWATATEKNNARFEVQRSADGQNFTTLGTVKGQGNSSAPRSYSYFDGRPLVGLSYYRLRQVDTDETATYSPVVNVKWAQEASVAAYPNPTTGIVTLPATLGNVRYRLLDILGKTVLSGEATGNDRLDLSSLKPGTFILEMTGATGRSSQRLVRE